MEKVMRRPGDYVIPHEAIPEVMSRISVFPEDKFVCLERTEPMFTTYWATAGELSPFFIAVMKEKKIIGARCPKCKMIICPPYMTRCPVCQNDDYSLVNLETGIEMPQVAYMLGTPPITVFANARFARYAPFGRFCESRLDLIPLVFNGHEDESLARGDDRALANEILSRARAEARDLARAYAEAGNPRDPQVFDDRSAT